MSQVINRIVVVGRDAPLWLSASVLGRALKASGVTVEAIELPSALGPSDVYATLPPLEALHNQLGIDESAFLRTVEGCFTLGQNFIDPRGGSPGFLHAYGAYGTAIDGKDFFAYWLKARGLGLRVGLEDFSLTASAARHGRLFIPDDDSEKYGRSDYGYHLPAAAYARSLKALAIADGVRRHTARAIEVAHDAADNIAAILCDGRRIEAQLFVDASGDASVIGSALGVAQESWADHFPGDRILTASGPGLPSIPAYAEIRAGPHGWTGLYPSQARTHVRHVYAGDLCSDEQALSGAVETGAIALTDACICALRPGRRAVAWTTNCIAIGAAACALDPVHSLELHAVQLGLVHLLAVFPATSDHDAERAEYNRIMRSSFERLRDFQSAYYTLNRYGDGAFWARAREAALSPALAHSIDLFKARGELAPCEDESFSPDSWRTLFIGHGLTPASYPPTVDRTPPEEVKARFRTMLGYVKEQVLRQPTHDSYLGRIAGRGDG